MQVVLVLLGYLGSAAGATVLIAIGTGLARIWAEGRPRQRIAAIRAAAETRALLHDEDSIAIRAIEGHMFSEAGRLQGALDRRNAAIVRREQRVPWRRTRISLACVAIALALGAISLQSLGQPQALVGWVTITSGVLTGCTLGWTALAEVDRALARRRGRLVAEWMRTERAGEAGSD